MAFKSQFLKTFFERGYFNQTTHEKELDELLDKAKISAYIGFDCTAPTLHIGSLIQIMVLRLLQKYGHTPIVLLGGGTTKIGDPSGKDEARQFLDNSTIERNLAGIKKTLEKFDLSKTDSKYKPFQFVNNEDWLKNLNYIDFLRDCGRHFSINRMLTFDSVKTRLDREHSLSFLEFNYMILQAYDFYILSKNQYETKNNNQIEKNKIYDGANCELQIGGSDQWGNIVNGVELTRRKSRENDIIINSKIIGDGEYNDDTKFAFGLTTPLLTTADGKKMGKTANGAVWLDKDLLDPFEYFQYFRNIDDKDVERFLKLFTEKTLEEIQQIQKEDINNQKKILAFEVTKVCHGEEEANKAKEKAEKIFSNKSDNIENLDEIKITFSNEELEKGKSLVNILKENNLCASNGEARRLIKGGGVKINDEKINDESYLVKFNTEQNHFKLQLGKKRFFKITIN